MPDFDPDAYLAGKKSEDFDPDAYLKSKPKAEPGMDELALKGLKKGLEYGAKGMQSVTDAIGKPVRAYMDSQGADKPFSESWENTPSWKDIYERAGLSGETAVRTPLISNPWGKTPDEKYVGISPAGAAAGLTEAAIDPTMYLAPMAASKVAGKAAGVAAKPIANLSPKVAEYLAKIAEERAVKASTGENVRAIRKLARVEGKSAGDVERAEANLRQSGRHLLEDTEGGPAVGWVSKSGDIAERASEKRKAYGRKIGDVGKAVDTAAPEGAISGAALAKELRDYAATIPPVGKGAALRERLEAEAVNMEAMGPMSFKKAQQVKNQFPFEPQAADALISSKDVTNKIQGMVGGKMDEAVAAAPQSMSGKGAALKESGITLKTESDGPRYYATAVDKDGNVVGKVSGFKDPDGKVTITQAHTADSHRRQGVASELARDIQEKAGGGELVFDGDKTADGEAFTKGLGQEPTLTQEYSESKKRYGTFKNVADAGTEQKLRALNRRIISPSTYGMGAAGAVAGASAAGGLSTAGLLGIGAAATNKLAMERGSAFAARAADALSKKFLAAPQAFQKWMPALQKAAGASAGSLVVTHHMLMQNDPEYRALIEGTKP